MADTTILLADNDPDFLVTRKEFLEREGYNVIIVENVTDARNELDRKSVMLAVLDIRLVDDDDEKDNSGLILAEDTAYREIPKIILTGFPSTDSVREALKLGEFGIPPAIDYLEKGQGWEAMLEAVDQALSSVSLSPWQPFLALTFLLGAGLTGVIAIIFGDPRWLVGTVVLGLLYALLTWLVME